MPSKQMSSMRWIRKQDKLQQKKVDEAQKQQHLVRLLREEPIVQQPLNEQPLEQRPTLHQLEEQVKAIQYRLLGYDQLTIQFFHKLKAFTKYYNEGIGYYFDSRTCIQFSREQLIELLSIFAELNALSRYLPNSNQAPFFGFSEDCFKQFLMCALNAWPVEYFVPRTTKELQFSVFGKNLMRNLLHTARTDIQASKYSTDPAVKACYIKAFHEACAELMAIPDALPDDEMSSYSRTNLGA